MSSSLFIPSRIARRALYTLPISMPNLPTAFRSHAMNTSQTMRSTMPPTASPRVGVLHTLLYTPPSVYAFASTWYRVLGLPWTLPAIFRTLHKAHKFLPQREGSSLIPFICGAASACVLRTPSWRATVEIVSQPAPVTPSICRDLVFIVSSVFLLGNTTRVRKVLPSSRARATNVWYVGLLHG